MLQVDARLTTPSPTLSDKSPYTRISFKVYRNVQKGRIGSDRYTLENSILLRGLLIGVLLQLRTDKRVCRAMEVNNSIMGQIYFGD